MKKKYITEEDKCPIFPRGQHPDERTNKQFLEILYEKRGLKESKVQDKYYPKFRRSAKCKLFCITNGKTYYSVKQIECEFGGDFRSRMSKHLKREYKTINGLEFLEIK